MRWGNCRCLGFELAICNWQIADQELTFRNCIYLDFSCEFNKIFLKHFTIRKIQQFYLIPLKYSHSFQGPARKAFNSPLRFMLLGWSSNFKVYDSLTCFSFWDIWRISNQFKRRICTSICRFGENFWLSWWMVFSGLWGNFV